MLVSILFRIPDELIDDIFSEWLTTAMLVMLDSSCCQKSLRSTFLDRLRCKAVCGSIYNGSIQGLIWLSSRNIRLHHLTLNFRLLAFIIQNSSIQETIKLSELQSLTLSKDLKSEQTEAARAIVNSCTNLIALDSDRFESFLSLQKLSNLTSLKLRYITEATGQLIIESCNLLRCFQLAVENNRDLLTQSYSNSICKIIKANKNLENVRMTCHYSVVECMAMYCTKLKTVYIQGKYISAPDVAVLISNNKSNEFDFTFYESNTEVYYDEYFDYEPEGISTLRAFTKDRIRQIEVRTNYIAFGLEDIFESFPHITKAILDCVSKSQVDSLLSYPSSTLQSFECFFISLASFKVLLQFSSLSSFTFSDFDCKRSLDDGYDWETVIKVEEIFDCICDAQPRSLTHLEVSSQCSYSGESFLNFFMCVQNLKSIIINADTTNISVIEEGLTSELCAGKKIVLKQTTFPYKEVRF